MNSRTKNMFLYIGIFLELWGIYVTSTGILMLTAIKKSQFDFERKIRREKVFKALSAGLSTWKKKLLF